GPGSAQLFVEFDPSQHYFTLQEWYADEFRRVALFDAIVNNADRKGGHCLLGVDGRIHLIDHGVCFSSAPKLRTVIWEFAGEAVPEELVAAVARFASELEHGPVRESLVALPDPRGVDTTIRRARPVPRT